MHPCPLSACRCCCSLKGMGMLARLLQLERERQLVAQPLLPQEPTTSLNVQQLRATPSRYFALLAVLCIAFTPGYGASASHSIITGLAPQSGFGAGQCLVCLLVVGQVAP